MTTYICKCGRRVRKNTDADNTGNRDTEDCKGCPYLLPWGSNEYVPGEGFRLNVSGHECRMSKTLEYATRFSGNVDDKCNCSIASLDFDFLEKVSNWILEYHSEELFGKFDRAKIRGIEYVSNGRYRLSIACAQNKKGMVAKAELLQQFFDDSGRRLDKTPEEEKAIVLAAIEAGKEKTRERKKNMDYIISKHVATGHLYAYFKGSLWFWDEHVQKWLLSQFAENLYAEQRRKMADFKRDDLLTLTSDFYLLDDYEVDSKCIEALLQCNPKTAQKESSTDAAGNANQCASTASEGSTQNPIFSAVATAVDSRTAEITEVSDLDSTTTAPAANDNEPREIVAESVLAGATGLTTFDYSGLDVTTVDTLNLAEKIIRTARQKYIVDLAGAVDMAHTELVVRNSDDSKHGNRGEQAFVNWCRFMGISKTTAYQLLQVQALISGANPEEQAVLEAASPSLLYAAAKPSAPAELVQAVKEGDITTHKQYQDALAKLKAAEEAEEKAQQEAAQAKQEAALDRKEREDAHAAAMRYKSECERRAQEQQRVEGLLEHQKQLTQEAQQDARGWEEAGMQTQEIVEDLQEQLAEKTARIKELESGQVIEATAIDQTEIDRRVKEAVEAENAKWEELCQNQEKTINTLKREGSVTAQVKSITSVVENLLDGLLFTVQNEGVSAENCMAVDGLLDTLQKYYNYFYDSIAGEEGNEDGEE